MLGILIDTRSTNEGFTDPVQFQLLGGNLIHPNRDMCITVNNRAYKAKGSVQTGIVQLPPKLLTDCFAQLMRKSLEDEDPDCFGPHGDYWKNQKGIYAAAELGQELKLHISWHTKDKKYHELHCSINPIEAACVNPNMIQHCVNKAKERFKK